MRSGSGLSSPAMGIAAIAGATARARRGQTPRPHAGATARARRGACPAAPGARDRSRLRIAVTGNRCALRCRTPRASRRWPERDRAPGGSGSGAAITLLIAGDCRKMGAQPVCGADVKHSRRYRAECAGVGFRYGQAQYPRFRWKIVRHSCDASGQKDAFEVLVKACRPLAYVAVRAKS